MNKKNLQIIIGLVFTVTMLTWLFWAVDWHLVWEEIQKAHYWMLIPVITVTIIHYILRAIRWRYLLPNSEAIKTKSLFDAIMIGNLATFILPLRAGEFIRPLYLIRQEKEHTSFPIAFASVVIERFLDLSCVLITLAIIFPFIPSLPDWVMAGAYILGMLAIAILVFMVMAIFAKDLLIGISKFFTSPLPDTIKQGLLKLIEEAIKGASVLQHPKNLILAVSMSVVIWLSTYTLWYISLFLFDMQYSFLLSTTTAIVVALAVAAPSAPGFVGIIQVATIAGFALFGESKEIATSYAIIQHVLQYILFVGYGFTLLASKGLKINQIKSS